LNQKQRAHLPYDNCDDLRNADAKDFCLTYRHEEGLSFLEMRRLGQIVARVRRNGEEFVGSFRAAKFSAE
jgi:hypothetical protein